MVNVTYKSRQPDQNDGRPLSPQTLKECGNEISITPKVDIFCGPIPDPDNTGLYHTDVLSISRDGMSATCSSSAEASKFKKGEIVNVFDTQKDINPVFLIRTAIASVSGSTINFCTPITVLARTIRVAKELVFRGSNKNCYRVDEYGFGRAYYAGLTSSEITQSMGNLFQYEWNTSDFNLTLENYQGEFNDYLPGGNKQINWGGKFVRVYLGTAEPAIKNRLMWEGITHFNSGLAEQNQVLNLNAYHISYIYNQELNKNRFINVLDKDFENKIIPIIYGDWTVNPFELGGGTFPPIPCVLVDKTSTHKASSLKIPYQDSGEATFEIVSTYNDGTQATALLGNTLKIELQFYNYVQPTTWDKSGAISFSVDNMTTYIKMFMGVDSSGVAYNSTQFIKDQINGSIIASSKFIPGTASPVPMRSNDNRATYNANYGDYVDYETLEKEAIVYTFGGGNTKSHLEYKISSNPLSSITELWWSDGDPKDEKSWLPEMNYLYSRPCTYTGNGSHIFVTLGNHGFTDGDIIEIKPSASSPFPGVTGPHTVIYIDQSNFKFVHTTNTNGQVCSADLLQPLEFIYDLQNGRVIVNNVPFYNNKNEELKIEELKLFCKCKGEILGLIRRKVDKKVFLNVANNYQYGITNKCISSINSSFNSNGGTSETVGVPAFTFGLGLNLHGAELTIESIKNIITTRYSFLGFDYDEDVTVTYTNYLWYKYSSPYHIFKTQSLTDTKDFIFEMEVNPDDYTYNYNNRMLLVLSNPMLQRFGVEIGLNQSGKPFVYFNNRSKSVVSSDNVLTAGTSYRLRVVKDNNVIKIFLKNLDTNSSYVESTYSVQDTWTELDNVDVYLAEIGFSNVRGPNSEPNEWETFKGKIGVTRFANNEKTFQDAEFIEYNTLTIAQNDPVTIAKRILQLGGVPDDLFDETWEQYNKDNLIYSYNARVYVGEENVKCIDEAIKMLGQIGFVLTMKPRDGKLKFSLIWDNIDHYQNNSNMITINDFDIEENSINTDPEINQYFNFIDAEYNYIPAQDEMNKKSLAFYEPNALKRDAGLQMWFKVEEKEKRSIELPNLYAASDVENRLKDCLAISTCNPEMINLNVSWRHIFMEVGQFVYLNTGRFQKIPCQIRELIVNANGSSVQMKLMSLQNINFKDAITGLEYTPANWDGVGGWTSKSIIINLTDGGNI